MVAPKSAWAVLSGWYPRSEYSLLRLLTIGALVASAFHLHERAGRLEERERLLERRIASIAQQSQPSNERVLPLSDLPAPLERVAEASGISSNDASSMLDDSGLRRADYERVQPVALKTANP